MRHLSEEALVLLYYGPSDGDSPEARNHLRECEACGADYGALERVLKTVDAAPLPARGPEYGAAVWGRIQGQVEARAGRRARFGIGNWWIWTPALAALLVAAFLAGRLTQRAQPATASSGQVRERILLVAVGDHLERSQMVLAELSHAPREQGRGRIDISDERRRAEDLLDDNRLYRQTARSAGDAAVANVLDDLERVLLEVAHSPSQISSGRLEDLRRQIEDRGLLFKVRVLGSRAREKEDAPMEPTRDGKRL